MVVGVIGDSVQNSVELVLRQELVQVHHQQMEELNVQEYQLSFVTHSDVLVKTILINMFFLLKYIAYV